MKQMLGSALDWNLHLLACSRKGMEARKAGVKQTDCPYKVSKGLNRQRRQYWQYGWIEQDKLMKGGNQCGTL